MLPETSMGLVSSSQAHKTGGTFETQTRDYLGPRGHDLKLFAGPWDPGENTSLHLDTQPNHQHAEVKNPGASIPLPSPPPRHHDTHRKHLLIALSTSFLSLPDGRFLTNIPSPHSQRRATWCGNEDRTIQAVCLPSHRDQKGSV